MVVHACILTIELYTPCVPVLFLYIHSLLFTVSIQFDAVYTKFDQTNPFTTRNRGLSIQ